LHALQKQGQTPKAMVDRAWRSYMASRLLEKRLADEIVALVRVALERLELLSESVDVLLGGGLFSSGSELLFRAVEQRLAAIAPHARPRVTDSPPIVGAALLGLDELAAGERAQARLRRELKRIFASARKEEQRRQARPRSNARPARHH